jgi:hypothetical protein
VKLLTLRLIQLMGLWSLVPRLKWPSLRLMSVVVMQSLGHRVKLLMPRPILVQLVEGRAILTIITENAA